MADCRAAAWVATSGLLGSLLPVETLEGALSGTPNSRVIKNMKRFIKEEILADAPTAEPTVVNNIVQTDIDERKRRRRYTRQSHAETNKTMEITLSVIPMGTPVRLWVHLEPFQALFSGFWICFRVVLKANLLILWTWVAHDNPIIT